MLLFLDISLSSSLTSLSKQKRHLEFEERSILPLIEKALISMTGRKSKSVGMSVKTIQFFGDTSPKNINRLPSVFAKVNEKVFN